jgi:ATP-binding protein involved in chromosome partitioning
VAKQNVRPERVEPTEDGQRLRIVWRDGAVHEYEPRAIRLACPCAGCVDEFTGRPILDPASVAADVKPVAIEYVGRYALKFTWPDGHDTGIYPYDLMRRLGQGGGKPVRDGDGTALGPEKGG